MLDTFEATNEVDNEGNPAGGVVAGNGLMIKWQNGPLGRDCCNRNSETESHAPGCQGGETRKSPNGAFVETVIAAAKQRIEHYQRTAGRKFACRENAMAITKLDEALLWLYRRTTIREIREVEGTHKP